ncbi:hypothetical protein [Acidiphilium sp.]|uniref:hypothetical protein n=1 Tax=Acidiphilium sp. TaxID=527 RepID=UPI003D00EAB4
MSNSREIPLLDLARRVQRLSPDRRDPERYHAEKSEIAAELRRLASTPINHTPSAAARPRQFGDN